ncbi:uncharacterized protein LOC144134311 [Amblyomma americanum]
MRSSIFFLALSLALLVDSGSASPLSFFTSKFRSLAEYKLAAAARMASYFSGDRAVKATVDLKVADGPTPPEPVKEGALEEPVEEPVEEPAEEAIEVPVPGPVKEVSVEQVVGAPAEEHAQPPQLSVEHVDPQQVYDFKKQFEAGYAALDFANQMEKRRLAGAASTSIYPQRYEPPVLSLPLEQYKEFVSAGTTGGELMRVAVVAQNAPQPSYFSSHPGSLPWAEHEQGVVPTQLDTPPEQQPEAPPTHQLSTEAPQEQQLSSEEPALHVGPAPPEGQSHIFPYGEWQTFPPRQDSPSYSYDIPTPASDAAPESSPPTSSPLPPVVSEHVVVPGRRLPPSITPDLASGPEDVLYTSAKESETPQQTTFADGLGPRYRREVAEEGDAMPVEVPALNATVSGQEVEQYFHFIKQHDKDDCLAKFICTLVSKPGEFGSRATEVDAFFE